MSLIESEKPFDKVNQQWALMALLCSLPIYFIFAQFGNAGRGRAAAICFAMAITAIRSRWDLRNYPLLWAVAALVALLHIPLLLRTSWSDRSFPGYTLLIVAVLDFGVYYGCFLVVAMVAKGKGGNQAI